MTEGTNQQTLDCYYKEKDPKKRGKILDEILKLDPSQDNQLRKEIYDLRYASKSQRNDGDLADGYMGLWMNMKLSVDNCIGFFGTRSARKELTKLLSKLQIPRFMEMGEKGQSLLYEEFYHMAALYVNASLTDRNYTSAFMGMISLKEDQLYGKITQDVFKVAYLMPQRADMEEEFSVFTRASRTAFSDLLPNCEEDMEQLIHKNK